MIKSPLRYPGGKSRAVTRISALLPEFQEYREPFLGGGSVFFYVKQQYPNRIYRVGDVYEALYTFWSECQVHLEAVLAQIWLWRRKYSIGKELFRFLKENMEQFGKIEKAAAFFIFNRITFSGTSESGGFSEAAFQKRFTLSSIVRLQSITPILHDTKIYLQDYQYLTDMPGDNVFIFLDPPYHSATKSALYGKNGSLHKSFDHERFASVMRHCPHKWLITYDDSLYIRELFSFANIIGWDLSYGMRNVSKSSNAMGKELFISNYLESLPDKHCNHMSLFA